MSQALWTLLFLIAGTSNLSLAFAEGGRSDGGGDAIKQDFLVSADAAYRLILKNGSSLNPPIDPARFGAVIEPAHIASTDEPLIYQNTTVDAYYNASTDVILINRSRWQSISKDDEKLKLAAHELFRRMGLDDDKYQISIQLKNLFDHAFDFSNVRSGDYIPFYLAGNPRKTCWIHLEKDTSSSTLSISLAGDQSDRDCMRSLTGLNNTTFTLKCDGIYGMTCSQLILEYDDPELTKFAVYVGLSFDDSYNFTFKRVQISLEPGHPFRNPNAHASDCYHSMCVWDQKFLSAH
jgi:hypothetical protein